MKEKFFKILPYSGYVLFLVLGLTIFFLGAFLVVVMRTKEDQKIVMPDLLGKSYLEVHNELQRSQIKVKLEELHVPERPDGIILTQSIDPGKEIEAGSKVYLSVNVAGDKVSMPELVGQNLGRAKAILESIPSGDFSVSLKLGGIVYVPKNQDELAETVVDQIPASGEKIRSTELVYLLVTEDNNAKPDLGKVFESFIDNPYPFAAASLDRLKIPFHLDKIQETKDRKKQGLIQNIKQNKNGVQITSYFYETDNKLRYGYKLLEKEVGEKDFYTLVELEKSEEETKEKNLVTQLPLDEDQLFRFLYYNTKKTTLTLVGRNSGESKTWNLEPKGY